jgi:hypothetical protein
MPAIDQKTISVFEAVLRGMIDPALNDRWISSQRHGFVPIGAVL